MPFFSIIGAVSDGRVTIVLADHDRTTLAKCSILCANARVQEPER